MVPHRRAKFQNRNFTSLIADLNASQKSMNWKCQRVSGEKRPSGGPKMARNWHRRFRVLALRSKLMLNEQRWRSETYTSRKSVRSSFEWHLLRCSDASRSSTIGLWSCDDPNFSSQACRAKFASNENQDWGFWRRTSHACCRKLFNCVSNLRRHEVTRGGKKCRLIFVSINPAQLIC